MTTLDIYWMYHVSHAEAVPSIGCLGLALGLAITRDDGPCSGVISEPGTLPYERQPTYLPMGVH